MMASNRIHKNMRPQKWRCSYVDLRTGRRCNATFTRKSNQQRHEREQHADDSASNFDSKSNSLSGDHSQPYPTSSLERSIDDLLQPVSSLDAASLNLEAAYLVPHQGRETTSQSIPAWNHFPAAQANEADLNSAPTTTVADLQAVPLPSDTCQAGDSMSVDEHDTFSAMPIPAGQEVWPSDTFGIHAFTEQNMAIFSDANITPTTVFGSTFDGNLPLDGTTLQELNSQHAFAPVSIPSIPAFQDKYVNDILMGEASVDLKAPIDLDAPIGLDPPGALGAHNHLNTLFPSWSGPDLTEPEAMQLEDDSFTTSDTASQPSTGCARELDRPQRRCEVTPKPELRLNPNVKITEVKINQQHNLEIRLTVELVTASQETSERFEGGGNIA